MAWSPSSIQGVGLPAICKRQLGCSSGARGERRWRSAGGQWRSSVSSGAGMASLPGSALSSGGAASLGGCSAACSGTHSLGSQMSRICTSGSATALRFSASQASKLASAMTTWASSAMPLSLMVSPLQRGMRQCTASSASASSARISQLRLDLRSTRCAVSLS